MSLVNNKHIAIIGGGSTGPVLLIYIAKYAKERNINLSGYTFHLIDPHGFGNGGIAYGKCAPTHILNTLRNEMSPWDRESFPDYLRSIGREDNPFTYPLRSDFGQYLQKELKAALATICAQGGEYREHHKKAFIRSIAIDTFCIVDEHEQLIAPELTDLSHQNIIITVGYGPNHNFQKLITHKDEGYIHELYPPTHLQDVLSKKKKPVTIAVLGSAAALYDFIYVCELPPEQVNLYIFSSVGEKGLEVRQVEKEHLLKGLTFDILKALPSTATTQEIINTVEKEFEHARKIEAGPDTWTAFMIMMNIKKVLEKFPEHIVKEFRQSEYFKKVKRLGGPTTQVSSDLLNQYNPTFIPVNVGEKNVEYVPKGKFKITIQNREYLVDCVVNATGHGRHNSAIIEDLKAHNLAIVDPKFDILATDHTGYRLRGSGIACIGAATHFGTDGIETFAKPTEHLARELLTQLQ